MSAPAPRFFLNHLGHEQGTPGGALVNIAPGAAGTKMKTLPAASTDDPNVCDVLTAAGWSVVASLPLGPAVSGFRGTQVRAVDLQSLPSGRYALRYGADYSHPFLVEKNLLKERTADAVLDYFRGQRSVGPWDTQDHSVPVFGDTERRVDAHGGWYDASGDVSKYLSHLSYANFMNPQQTPIVVWGLLEHLEVASALRPGTRENLKEEAAHGAEFLERMLDPAGYFYMTVFDQWSKGLDRRFICSYRTQKGTMETSREAGYRQGGGASIAALARAGRVLERPTFINAAKRAFAHLEANNKAYLDDGQENIIDDYCALLAAAELYAVASEENYLQAAEARAERLLGRIQTAGPHPGWLRADDGERPFYHAAEAGLPVVALLRLREVLGRGQNALKRKILDGCRTLLSFELWITQESDNPFGYARQYVQDADGERRLSFFIPHKNETGYWWQGENARLGSLAAAAGKLSRLLPDGHERSALTAYAHSQLDWICGKNPFDACMLAGFGRNGGNYLEEWSNVPGGICNGITSSFEDETDVDFGRTDVEGDHSWRWHEQWIPHAAWYLIALAELSSD